VAKKAFTRSGANASLDDIAKRQVLEPELCSPLSYARCTDRSGLSDRVEKLAAAEKSSESLLPSSLASMDVLFVDYIATKQIIAPL